MNVVHPIAEKIVAMAKASRMRPVRVSDLASLGVRPALDQALSRLVREGRLLRVRRGIYQYPRLSPVLNLPVMVPTDQVMQAWARNNGVRLVPAGARAANLLRLSTQVPAKLEYCTNGPTRTIFVGTTPVRLRHRGPRTMDAKGLMSATVMEALRYLGKDRVGDPDIRRLRATLSTKDKAQLLRNLPLAPAWMRPVLEAVATGGTR